MVEILSKKAIAIWLIQNTSLTFEQISQFCSLSIIEIQSMADGNHDIKEGLNPIENGQLTIEEIHRCERDEDAILIASNDEKYKFHYKPAKSNHITTNDSISAIIWLLKKYPSLENEVIAKLSNSSIDMVRTIKNRGGKLKSVIAHNPIKLGLCTQSELEKYVKS
ncbi:cell cycle transcriptional regulator TrcR [Candidatus Gromoviella agglomerans]|uniref:cell cycle transcriptional regulator TrcR n=1 Tax=Candidatus Gromoviella agglomerans TaxID=2806609 RepID=UPI001E2D603D|nr:cell cycle transcriptional regulator TrcR [Candidatus Gromoviella agglomerans]UFX98397.1 DUF1013 domain-containing protein [Candidatus Gromoviella agglomerans]